MELRPNAFMGVEIWLSPNITIVMLHNGLGRHVLAQRIRDSGPIGLIIVESHFQHLLYNRNMNKIVVDQKEKPMCHEFRSSEDIVMLNGEQC